MLILKYVVYNKYPNSNGLCAYYMHNSLNIKYLTVYQVAQNSKFHFYKYQVRLLLCQLHRCHINTADIVITPLLDFKREVNHLEL